MLFCYFSNSPFTSAFRLCFLFNHATLGLRPCLRFCLHSGHNLFFIVPFRSHLLCTAPLTSFFNDVFDRILSAVNGTDAPTLLSVSFDITPTAHSTCCRWILYCKFSSTARGCFTSSVIWLLPSWPHGKTVHSLPHGSKFDFRSLFAFDEPTRGRVLVQLCAELVVFLGPVSSRGHLTALISAFNIQVESPSQHLFRCNIVWAHATTSYVI